ncbi:hypothetical protein LTR85_004105 [Meristemomyces frigidus]|nr:hypothetical protein LTR85_004105 [Meristemomyces frigidus]
MAQHEEQTTGFHTSSLSTTQRGHLPPTGYADKQFYRYHQHSISDTTANSASNDSSPTTTASTVDDSSATEPSPGSSPESPPPSTFAASMLRPRTSDDTKGSFFELQKQPPPKKGRNLKNLAVVTARQPKAASTTSLPLQLELQPTPALPEDENALASPAFVKPPSPPKRKPSNLGLTLLTPGMSKSPPQGIRLAIPPTPAFGRPATLRHFQSSPSLPLFPGLDSQTGIGSHVHNRTLAAPLETIMSPIELPKQVLIAEEEEQNFDVPLSREEKPEAYPDGPICVYDPSIDLYLEPTAEQCRQYDVVMNVASEVRNPMVKDAQVVLPTEPEIRIDGGGGIQYVPKHIQMRKDGEGNAALENSPTTPKATPHNSVFPVDLTSQPSRKDPEYIHIPWEHNSDIVPDLLRLVKLIDDMVKQRKRVLVHCQCGVSRSASLVVAYGLYKDPTMSVQEAYDVVKRRSKWIGPNMNLIMQLQEFRTSLARGGLLPGNRGFTPITPSSAFSEWRGPFSANPSDSASRNGPMTAGVTSSAQMLAQEEQPSITPGPSSAPSGLRWPVEDHAPPIPVKSAQRTRAVSAVKPVSAYVSPCGVLVPVLKVVGPEAGDSARTTAVTPDLGREDSDSATPTEALASPRSEQFAMTPLQPSAAVDSDDSFGLMSPSSTTGFPPSPFARSNVLASLGMGSVQPADVPRRALSLRTRSSPQKASTQSTGLAPGSAPRLRGKVSSPTLREHQQLQSLQAKIGAAHSHRNPPPSATFGGMDDALMSPRATSFTKNPFALAFGPPEEPALDEAPNSSIPDPRSPAQTGVSPITRNILDVL